MTEISGVLPDKRVPCLFVDLRRNNWQNKLISASNVDAIRIEGYPNFLISLDEVLFVIKHASRLKAEGIVYSSIDFSKFKNVEIFHTWPVKSLWFDHCFNLHFYYKQIFSMTCDKKGNSGTNLEYLSFESRNFSFEELKAFKLRITEYMGLNFQIKSIYLDSQQELMDRYRDPENLKLNLGLNAMIKKNVVVRLNCRQAIFTILMAFNRRKGCIINCLPRDIVMILVKLIWKSKTDSVWLPRSNITNPKTILDFFDWKLILESYNTYNVIKGTRDTLHLKLDSRHGEEWIEPANELIKQKWLLTSLLITISDVVYPNLLNSPNCRIYPRTVIMMLSKIIDLGVEQLEIRGIDFDQSGGYEDIPTQGSLLEHFNGEDDKICEIDQIGYRELHLTEIRLIKCLEVGQFLHHLFKILDKDVDNPYVYTGLPVKQFEPRINDYFSEKKGPIIESSISIRINSSCRTICISPWQQ